MLASRSPNGAISVATLGRISTRDSVYFPLANITIEAGNGKNPIGIFGKYKVLTLKFNRDISDSGTNYFEQIVSIGHKIIQPSKYLCSPYLNGV